MGTWATKPLFMDADSPCNHHVCCAQAKPGYACPGDLKRKRAVAYRAWTQCGFGLPVVTGSICRRASLNSRSMLALWWLAGMTLLALGLSFARGGLGRKAGALLVVVYAGFVILVVLT